MEISFSSSLSQIYSEESENQNTQKILTEIEEIKKILNNSGIYKNDKIFCKECENHILIQYIDFQSFMGECKCGKKKYTIEKDYTTFYYNTIPDDLSSDSSRTKGYDISFLFSCKKHSNKFKFYCLLCKENLCDDCKKFHENKNCGNKDPNNFYSFEKKQNEMIKDINDILEYFKLKKFNEPKDKILSIDLDTSGNPDKMNIKQLVLTLIMEYFTTPNYATIQNIKNFLIFYNNLESKDKLQLDLSEQLRIYSESKYQENKSRLNYITKIEIMRKNFNIDLLKNNLNNLEVLILSKNCIKNLEALSKIKILKLKYLDLSFNCLGNGNIDIIKNLNFPDLNHLILGNNDFSDYDIFKAIENFKNLKVLFLNSNPFKFEEKDNKEVKYNFELIEELYLSNGVFSEESIVKIFGNFKLKELKILNLSGNNLNTLSFFKFIKHLQFLQELYLNNNDIDDAEFDYKSLASIKSLQNIYIEYNLLSDDKYIKEADLDKNLMILGNDINLDSFIEKMSDDRERIEEIAKKSCEDLKKKFEIKNNQETQ